MQPRRSHSAWLDAPDGADGGGPDAVDAARLRDLSLTLEDGLFEIIDTYLEDTPRLIDEMRSDCARADWLEVKRLAHSLKSSSGIFGAQKMVALCAGLETAAGERSPRCAAIIEAAGDEFRRIGAALADYVRSLMGRE